VLDQSHKAECRQLRRLRVGREWSVFQRDVHPTEVALGSDPVTIAGGRWVRDQFNPCPIHSDPGKRWISISFSCNGLANDRTTKRKAKAVGSRGYDDSGPKALVRDKPATPEAKSGILGVTA
jgi:hypothetical protein